MSFNTLRRLTAAAVLLSGPAFCSAWAHDVRITLPRHSEATPVQRLNREGVEAVRKQQYEKAEAIFYKAYLFDPADPFTLNNLGYVAELQGQLDRARKFYGLATEQGDTASIDRSTAKQLQGKPMMDALNSIQDVPMRINRMNVEALGLISDGRSFEAVSLLNRAVKLDPHNPFSLNNLGVANEALGDYDSAIRDYSAAADLHSKEPIVIALDRSWRGKPVSKVAAQSAKQLTERMQTGDVDQARASMLAVQGVSAINRNDWTTARQDFLQAYKLDPHSAFSLNNLGYLYEKEGDPETAQDFYSRAQEAVDAKNRIGLATDSADEGKLMVEVATASDQKIDTQLDQRREERRQQAKPNVLRRRDGSISEPPAAAAPSTSSPAVPAAPADSNAPSATPPPQ